MSAAREQPPEVSDAQRILALGWQLGIPALALLRTDQLADSGIPEEVLADNEGLLPIRFDPYFFNAMKTEWFEAALELNLSFDALYRCVLPWSAFVSIQLTPQPLEVPGRASEEPKPEVSAAPGLHLVD